MICFGTYCTPFQNYLLSRKNEFAETLNKNECSTLGFAQNYIPIIAPTALFTVNITILKYFKNNS